MIYLIMEPLEVTDVDFHMLCERDDKGMPNIIENTPFSWIVRENAFQCFGSKLKWSLPDFIL